MKRSYLKRSTKPLQRSWIKRGSVPMKKNGRRTNDWRAVWRWLKPRLEARNRVRCEFDFIPHECYGPLDPCHSKKRRMMQGNDIYAVAIGCRNAHQVLDERMPHEEMEQTVMEAINGNGGLILPESAA